MSFFVSRSHPAAIVLLKRRDARALDRRSASLVLAQGADHERAVLPRLVCRVAGGRVSRRRARGGIGGRGAAARGRKGVADDRQAPA
eukprot:4193860-Prymnesium_polylepis.1